MSRETDQIIPDGRWLDQLVDDELDESDRRRLLAGLDLHPDGWRKCAMAFLEAQAWRHALGRPGADVNASPCKASSTSGAVTADRDVSDVGACASAKQDRMPWYAMAVCLFVAFVVGAGVQRVFSRHQSAMVPRLVEAEGGGNGVSTDNRITPLEGIMVQVGGPGTPGETIPVRQLEEKSEMVDASTSPARLLEALRRSGHRIHRRRGIVPFSFEDGRQGFVPVEDLYVVPTNLTTY